ncbi:Mov34/MPN/PAD-1 family protein [Pararhizobium sp. O133]|uniref:Mov34/MPN/PAD-1 family protein n=1 Tax=Pararhizobium sp. O133 TaxID=3449278 RepID=UPI003F684617
MDGLLAREPWRATFAWGRIGRRVEVLSEEYVYKFGDLAVELTPAALATMLSHRQRGFFSKEAGGQLFATLSRDRWCIEVATGPRRGDRRGRFHFWPDRKAEQEEITRFHERGLEFVGDWHTHPENSPTPSNDDMTSVANVVRESLHNLPGILMCIVGRRDPPDGLWLSYHCVNGAVLRPERPKPELIS